MRIIFRYNYNNFVLLIYSAAACAVQLFFISRAHFHSPKEGNTENSSFCLRLNFSEDRGEGLSLLLTGVQKGKSAQIK